MEIFKYSVADYPFHNVVAAHLGVVGELNQIHKNRQYPVFKRENDQSTDFHKKFYQIGAEFYDLYRRFLWQVVKPRVKEDFIYQRIPNFRVQFPNNLAVGEFHRDRDYFHNRAEVNYWMPLTDTSETNTVWIESAEGKEDFKPYVVKHGEVLIFNGANLKHGNKINQTDNTRVSLDFRILPRKDYKPREEGSINSGIRFVIGQYYEEL